MEFAALSSKGINQDMSHLPEELSPIRSAMFTKFSSWLQIWGWEFKVEFRQGLKPEMNV